MIRETTAPLRRTRLAMKRTLARREDRASYSAKREKIVKATGPGIQEARPQALAELVFEEEPGARIRRRPL